MSDGASVVRSLVNRFFVFFLPRLAPVPLTFYVRKRKENVRAYVVRKET